MSDGAPLRLAGNGHSSSASQSSESQRFHNNQQGQSRSGGNATNKTNQSNRGYESIQADATSVARRLRSSGNHHQVIQDNEDERQVRERSFSESSSKSGQLRYGAMNVIELFIPVTICMLIVVGTMKATDNYRYSSQTVFFYAQVMFTDQSVDTGTRVWQSFANAFIMLIFIVIMTTILILLYKFRWYKVIHGWLILSSLILLFMFTLMYIGEILKVYNMPVDTYTVMIFIWNFGVVGMICIHWRGPLPLQQAYLITISALLALVFIRALPDWTTWTVLAIMSVWDLIAVLCPRGPLRILVETAQERNEAIFPALIYSSTMVWCICNTVVVNMADQSRGELPKLDKNKRPSKNRDTNRRDQGSPSRADRNDRFVSQMSTPSKREQHPVEIQYEGGAQLPEVEVIQPSMSNNWPIGESVVATLNSRGGVETREPGSYDERLTSGTEPPVPFGASGSSESRYNQQQQQVVEERGVKLGLGDFIFYSLLVGKASSFNDWIITLSCYVAILVGLCFTLSLLAVFKKALPALPISIAFGLCSLLMSYVFAVPFAKRLTFDQIFI